VSTHRPKQHPDPSRRAELLDRLEHLNRILAGMGADPLVPNDLADNLADWTLQALVNITGDHILTVTRAMKGHTS
jgi:hypothetical protein